MLALRDNSRQLRWQMLIKTVRILGPQALDVMYYAEHLIKHNILRTEDVYNNEGARARLIAYAMHPREISVGCDQTIRHLADYFTLG